MGRNCQLTQRGLRGSLTCPAEGASDLDLWSVEVRMFPRSQVVLNLHDGLQPLRRPLGEVIEAFIILIIVNRIKPNELLCDWWAHVVLHQQGQKSNHVGPPVGSYLENNEPEVFKDLDEERVQREPHSELGVVLRQSDVTIRMGMQSLHIVRLDHFEDVFLGYPSTIL